MLDPIGFHMFLTSWWEISENGDWGSNQNLDSGLVIIVVCPGQQFSKKSLETKKYKLFENEDVQQI